ncbi:hypothetical protein GA0116948_109135 [Chitinophaga costaii]|uniref:DUF5977 domain-containing protein n=1 Tax=Chitinophaga costaii TaxID=1335309 RepID=A0A1C4ER29_9BACT|nr:hypothetical protein [Chitinophaga costaii]PUZ22535.1 hypothetical protein DCM91_14810 [Chitinophaga costaii]SCC46075.1 hypothetical protein GA0116948_109135 [Chitinophaga costaii]
MKLDVTGSIQATSLAQITAPNQTVPHAAIYANVANGRFAAKAGVTIPNDTKCVTTTEVKTLVWLQESYLPATDNQLPMWQQLVPYFTNTIQIKSFRKTCSSGYTGNFVLDTIVAGIYVDSTQALADSIAYEALLADGPVNANNKGTCTMSCSEEGYKMIDEICTLGTKIWTGRQRISNLWYCTYYYSWPDGTQSATYTTSGAISPCPPPME